MAMILKVTPETITYKVTKNLEKTTVLTVTKPMAKE